TRASRDPRFTTGSPYPPADVVILHLHTGSLDIVPGLELPPLTRAGLAFDATGRWLLTTVSEGRRCQLLTWRQGMPGPALVSDCFRQPGPFASRGSAIGPNWRIGAHRSAATPTRTEARIRLMRSDSGDRGGYSGRA
ncbi:MAG TPA: hypothetical protein VGJ54_12690, partial [Streptosporangiaceae bacterium]